MKILLIILAIFFAPFQPLPLWAFQQPTADSIFKYVGIVAAAVSLLGVVAILLYGVFRRAGGDTYKSEADAFEKKANRLEHERERLVGIILKYRRARKSDRQLIYRLSAKKENIDIDIDAETEIADFDDEDLI